MDIMILLYGAPVVPCHVCSINLNDPEHAHPRDHPTIPFKTVALCDMCFDINFDEIEEPVEGPVPLSIRIPPEFAECAFCTKTFRVNSNRPPVYCSRGCVFMALNPGPKKVGAALKQPRAREGTGPCDCDDYEKSGVCSMVAAAS